MATTRPLDATEAPEATRSHELSSGTDTDPHLSTPAARGPHRKDDCVQDPRSQEEALTGMDQVTLANFGEYSLSPS